jgi:hypothetical protein
MKLVDLIERFNAEIVGSRVKAIIDGVHHFLAEIVDGNPVLTAAGQVAVEELKTQAPDVATVVAAAPKAVAEIAAVVPTLTEAASGASVVEAVAKPVAEKAAVDAVDSILDGITKKATKAK